MVLDIGTKINKLLDLLPPGGVATSAWLAKQGVSPQLLTHYEKSGWLVSLGYGAYTRHKDSADWPGAVCALQTQMGLAIHIGGKSALGLKHLLHFIPIGGKLPFLYLFHEKKRLPAWFIKYPWKTKLVHTQSTLFGKEKIGLTSHVESSFSLQISTPERAIIELLAFVPDKQSIEEALLILEGLVTLRHKLLQELLEVCHSIKVKRLFLALAKQCQPPWLEKLDVSKISLGKGSRHLAKGAGFDSEFLITIPKKERKFPHDE